MKLDTRAKPEYDKKEAIIDLCNKKGCRAELSPNKAPTKPTVAFFPAFRINPLSNKSSEIL
jgi:hypothetical protein